MKNYEGYLQSLGEVLVQYARDAKLESQKAAGTDDQDFADGYLSAYYRIITLMEQHAEIYDLTKEQIGLEGISESDIM